MSSIVFNGLCKGDALADFEAFCVSPVAHENGECIAVCDPDRAEFFAIYGFADHEWRLVHDCLDDDAGTAIIQICQATGRSIAYRDDLAGTTEGTPARLCDYLTTRIHDEIPGHDDPEDFREDDFDNHPLAPLREQLVAALEQNGQ